jgi:glycerol-3-phosphate dehydrogenase (NAD(P)+)
VKRMAILGAGSFGTALAVHASRAGVDVVLWARRPELAAELGRTRVNARYLPGVELPPRIRVTNQLADVQKSGLALLAVPSHGFRQILRGLLEAGSGSRELVVVSAAKGIEGESLWRMSQLTAQEAAACRRTVRFAVLSGPSFAEELARGTPTAAVVASEDRQLARRLQETLSTGVLRLYTSCDVVGVELGGAAKNVIAIASGVISGLGFGHNTLAALITRGLHEVTRLGLAYGGQPRTLYGLAGLGDLVLTCTGSLSRNRRAGLALAEGRSLAELERTTGMVAEGVRSSVAIRSLARRKGVEMPIAEQMVEVINGEKSPRQAVEELMSRELKEEADL